MTTNNAGTMGVVESDFTRVDFHELLDRQIIEYRKLVGFHRLEMSVQKGRFVSWMDAEHEVSRIYLQKAGHEAAA